MITTPPWLSVLETLTFFVLIGTVIYNRVNAVQKTRQTLSTLQSQFEQYQRDMHHYLEICELCRSEVRKHHENQTAEHVTSTLKDQIKDLVRDVADIKRFLMENPRA
jgi:uncharacterized membrane-anchored protein YhcB (DUF1043 family)